MTATQKDRWASKAAKYTAWADSAEAAAQALHDRWAEQRKDIAFLTQPGRIVARERFHADTQRAFELTRKAEAFRAKASNLHRMAAADAGEALARHRAEDEAVIAAVSVGDTVDCVYGRLRVAKVNRKSLTLEGRFGPLRIDAHLCRKVAA